MIAKCTDCRKKFEPKIERRMLDNDIQEIFFSCPKCSKRYHVAFTNTEIRKLNEEMQLVKDQLLKDKTNKELFARMQGLMRIHKKLMDKLNKKETA